MTVEFWALLAAVLLAVAALSGILGRRKQQGLWQRMVLPARAAALIPLALALGLAVMIHGQPSPMDLRQVALGLGLTISALGLGLAWRRGPARAGIVQDLVVMSLVLAAILAIQPGGSPLSCTQQGVPFWTYWSLFVLGSGSILLGGSVALDLAVEAILPASQRRAARADAHQLLIDTAFGALVTLGSGLTISIWWSWRTWGSLTDGEPRLAWMGATWLAVGMSLLAWQSERRGARLAAALAVLAAAMALFGLLAIPDLQRLWGL